MVLAPVMVDEEADMVVNKEADIVVINVADMEVDKVADMLADKMANEVAAMDRPSNTGFGIWDLPQKSSTKAKFGTLGLNWDFFGTIFIPFWDF